MTDTAEHSALLTAALAYASGGLEVFPLHSITLTGTCTCGNVDCESPGKHPRTRNGLKNATDDIEQITAWWEQWPSANIGVATGSPGLYVVDIDGERGATSWGALAAEHGGEVATRSVRTGNGRHLWYLTTRDDLKNSASRIADGVDTRGRGGYVVAPPSIHASGGGTLYSWENPGSPLTRLPDWIADLLAVAKPSPAMPFTPTGQPDPETVNNRLKALAGRVAIAESGNRNHTLNWAAYQAGRMVGGNHCDKDTAVRALMVGAERAGLGETESRKTIESGIESGKLQPDTSTPGYDPPPVTTIGRADVKPDPERTIGGGMPTGGTKTNDDDSSLARALSRIVTGAEFILDTDHQIDPVWGDDDGLVAWARGEPLYLTGPTGVGKTTVAHQIIERLLGVTTTPLFDLPVTSRSKKVLYLACDRPNQIRRAFARRFTEEHRDTLGERLVVHNGYLPVMIDQDPMLPLQIVQAVGADVLVVDSLKDVATELEKGPQAQAINAALQLVCQTGCDVIVLHHQRKSQGDNKRPKSIDDLYGNTLLPAGAGSVILLWGKPGDLAIELHHLKKPADEIGPLKLIHHHERGETVIDEDARVDLVQLAGRIEMTVAMAAQRLFGTDPTAKTQQARNEREKARRILDKAVSAGTLAKVERYGGLPVMYAPTDPSPDVPTVISEEAI